MTSQLVKITLPMKFDVVLERISWMEPAVQTNVPWSVIHHSPTGFEWGYGGSGPADLALNILNAFIPPGHDGSVPLACHEGECSRTALLFHQEFKNQFLVSMPREGGVITAQQITDFITEQQMHQSVES
jgi:hypothetical protein